MYFRSQKRSAGELLFSDELESDGEGGALVLGDTICDDSEEVLDRIGGEEMREALLQSIATELEPREKDIIAMRYGIGGAEPKTQREIAAERGISRSYVSRIEKKALEKLRAALCEKGLAP